jgi:hypothetical protein
VEAEAELFGAVGGGAEHDPADVLVGDEQERGAVGVVLVLDDLEADPGDGGGEDAADYELGAVGGQEADLGAGRGGAGGVGGDGLRQGGGEELLVEHGCSRQSPTARAMRMRMTSLVPSPISSTLASR